MSSDTSGIADRRDRKYLTATLLAVFALGLFLFTLYSGLK